MTPPSDDLGDLWQSVPSEGKTDPRALLEQLHSRARSFDRTIRNRDWREYVAGALIAVWFLWMSLHAKRPLERASDYWLAGYGVWIVFYLRRYSRVGKPAPDQALDEFRRALVERYDRQIRLLRSAKYWYILPAWAGLMLYAADFLNRTGHMLEFGLMAGAFTLMNGVLWWANDVAGVRYLRKQKRQVMDLFGDEGELQ